MKYDILAVLRFLVHPQYDFRSHWECFSSGVFLNTVSWVGFIRLFVYLKVSRLCKNHNIKLLSAHVKIQLQDQSAVFHYKNYRSFSPFLILFAITKKMQCQMKYVFRPPKGTSLCRWLKFHLRPSDLFICDLPPQVTR